MFPGLHAIHLFACMALQASRNGHIGPAQDFEALTPNLLARTMETVEGGGMIVLLLSNMQSLTQLYSLAMDAHARLRTESHQAVVGARCDCQRSAS